jgi:hypothetical protein
MPSATVHLQGEFDFSDERRVDSIGFWLSKKPPLNPR